MRRVEALVLLVFVSLPLHGTEEPGSYLFLYSQLTGCGETRFVVDYAKVPENGMVTLLNGIEISILGLPKEEIEKVLVERVGEKIGQTPKTLSVELVPATDSKLIAEELLKLLSSAPVCTRSEEPEPLPDLGFIRTLASTPPNKSLHPPPDASVTALAAATAAPDASGGG